MIDRLWVLTFFIGVASDVLSGALRHYTAVAGVPQAVYLPKVMMLACIIVILVHRPKISYLLAALYMAAQTCVALSNGVELGAVGFWVWTVSPMIFAVLAPPGAIDLLEKPGMRFVFVMLVALCMIGVLVNYFVPLPWIGKSVRVGDVDVHIAAASWVGSVKRLPGFGRDSAATGLMIGMLTTWMLPRFRSFAVTSLVLVAATLAIWGTTNKTTLVAVLFAAALNYFGQLRTIKRACIWAAALTFLVPLAGFVATSWLNHVVIGTGVLESMQDRFVNTWPKLLEGLLRENLIWFGVGPGGFGSATNVYPQDFNFNVAFADNTVLYAVGSLGIFGTILLGLLLTKFVLSREANDRRAWLMLFFLLVSAVTTDIFEAIGCLLFFGATLRTIWINSERSVLPSTDPHRRSMAKWRKTVSATARRQWNEHEAVRGSQHVHPGRQ